MCVRGGGASQTRLDAEAGATQTGRLGRYLSRAFPVGSPVAAVDSASLNVAALVAVVGGFLPAHWLPVLVSASHRLWDEIMMR